MIADNVIITGSLKTPEYSADPRGIGAWSIGGAIITTRKEGSTAGTQNAALYIGGQTGILGTGGNTTTSCTEEYNGTAWSVGGTLNVTRSCAVAGGTQNDAFVAGGILNSSARGTLTATSEEYDGTSWILGGTLLVARCYLGGAGNTNAGIIFGGGAQGGSATIYSSTEEYDGTTWTAGGAMATTRRSHASAGTQNAALAINGTTTTSTPNSPRTDEYNGTTWSTGGNTSFARSFVAGGGTQNDAFVAGGADSTSLRNNTEIYDGTVWRTGASTNKYYAYQGGAGSSVSDAIIVGAAFPNSVPFITCTEEYSTTPSTACVSSSSLGSLWLDTSKYELTLLTQANNVWIYGPSMITTNRQGSAGTSDSSYIAINTGGFRTPANFAESCTEEFDGTTWATGGALTTGRFCHRVVGTQNAALSIGGLATGSVLIGIGSGAVIEYDGTTWTSGGNLITNRYGQGATGTQNAALVAGGATPTSYVTTSLGVEEYNGTAWSSANGMAVDRWGSSATGTQNAAIFANGAVPTSVFTGSTTAQTYDGTNWTTISSTNIAKAHGTAMGTQNATRTNAGATSTGGGTDLSEIYDGYIWSMTNPTILSTITRGQTGGGSVSSGLFIDGSQITELLTPLSVYSTPVIASTGSV